MAASAESIEELYRSRYASFRGGLAALTGSYDTARDVLQEAFAQALRDREQYRGDGSLAAWVWRIAFRVALRSRSDGQRDLTLDELVAAAPLPSPERDPLLAEALKRLSPQRRLIVFLRYFADLSYAEIASLCEISEGTVAATLAHARSDLLKEIQREETPR
ncbi:MAG: RNA polymerase sigma factor [Gaiellaceae bacterium]